MELSPLYGAGCRAAGRRRESVCVYVCERGPGHKAWVRHGCWESLTSLTQWGHPAGKEGRAQWHLQARWELWGGGDGVWGQGCCAKAWTGRGLSWQSWGREWGGKGSSGGVEVGPLAAWVGLGGERRQRGFLLWRQRGRVVAFGKLAWSIRDVGNAGASDSHLRAWRSGPCS